MLCSRTSGVLGRQDQILFCNSIVFPPSSIHLSAPSTGDDFRMSGDKSKRNSVSRSKDNKSKAQKDTKKAKDNDGDEEMTVVVPPVKTDQNGDIPTNGAAEEKEEDVPVDPKVKATTGTRFVYLSWTIS